jgi:uncharacterized protein (TIGR02118 family)
MIVRHRATARAQPEIREIAMTVKLVALWSTPEDAEGFEKEYAAIHIPLVAAVPGLKGAVASKALNGPYYRMAELIFEDGEALQHALGSEEGLALLADSGRLQEAFGSNLDVLTVEEQARI